MSERGESRSKRTRGMRRTWKGVSRGARNAMTILRQGRLSAPYRAPFDVVVEDRTFRLRHYVCAVPDEEREIRTPLLLVPPLMVTSEIYDISPELSAVTWLVEQGIDVWLCDFGNPEEIEGGLERTLDDHVLAVDRCIDEVVERTGQDIQLAGYSQGGMFCYQTAAYRQSRNLKGVITFGSPVDVRKIIPVPLHSELATRLIAGAHTAVQRPLDQLSALPGAITSTGFKLLSVKKEVQQAIEFFGLLPDRSALEKREPRRRFLNGEGFVAWPAPALRRFLDEVVVKNLMANGGLVINHRPVTLADITCPILCFVGLKDEIARPAAVRSIHGAAPQADIYEVDVPAGHFGLVVGSRALSVSWPSVVEWTRWHEGLSEEPDFVREDEPVVVREEEDDASVRDFYDAATDWIESAWSKLGDATLDFSNTLETMRWQIPRLARLRRLSDSSRVSPGRALAEQAEAIGDSDFFLWGENAFTYREANARVNQFVHALRDEGIEPGDHVGVLMNNHPDYLTVVVALSRMGAVSVLFNSGLTGLSLKQALNVVDTRALVVDPEHSDARAFYEGQVLRVSSQPGEPDEGIVDLHFKLDPAHSEPPTDIPIDAGEGNDTAFLMFTSGTEGMPKAARITNRRWAAAALGAAAGAQLTNRDTVYCCLPLYHATGLLIGCGGALVGGSRLALGPRFSTSTFWNDVHRYGASVVVYVGELARYLVNASPSPLERSHSVRLFVGNGMRADVWERVQERFGGVRVIEFYGSTEGNVVLANLTGKKIGSVGREMMEETEVALALYDHETSDFDRDEEGFLRRAGVNQPGVLLSRIMDVHPMTRFDGYIDPKATNQKILRDVFDEGDAWFNTGDMLKRDADGDYWFIDRLGDTFRWKGENVSTEQVSNVLTALDDIDVCSVYGVKLPGREGRAGMAAVQLKAGHAFDGEAIAKAVDANLFPAARPLFIRVVQELPVTSTLKLVKRRLQDEGADPRRVSDALYYYDEKTSTYKALSSATYDRLIESV